ncbi:AraC family transcriptional regulator [Paenibacillus koleovorans]|uniref:AraC family transcriptional regulator n=1 Tax=Paenibacillus koleovorans TaxID=121608 RepID=UPI000FD78EED|nr:AraC family transcriptional regulator [Paenibacillus koleovorans]
MAQKLLQSLTYQRKLLLFCLFLSIAPVLLIGAVATTIASRSLQEEVGAHQATALKVIQVQTDNLLVRMEQISLSLAGNPILLRAIDEGVSTDTIENSRELMNLLQNTVLSSNIPFDVSLVMTKFSTVYSFRMGMLRQIDYPLNEIVKTTQMTGNQAYKIPPNTYTNQKELLLVRTVPLNSPHPKAILVLHLNPKQLQELIGMTELSGKRYIYLLDDQNRLMARDPEDATAGGLSPTGPISGLQAMLQSEEPLPVQIHYEGEAYFVTNLQSALNGWKYIVMSPVAEVHRKSNNIQSLTWLIVLVIAMCWGLLAALGSKRLFAPLQRLIARTFAKEDQALPKGRDVMGALHAYMTEMKTANERLHGRLAEQSFVMKEHALLQLIRGEQLAGAALWDGADYLAVLQRPYIVVGLAEIDAVAGIEPIVPHPHPEPALMTQALCRLLEELAAASGQPLLAASPKQGQVVFLLGIEHPEPEAEAEADHSHSHGHSHSGGSGHDYSHSLSLRELYDRFRQEAAVTLNLTVSLFLSDPKPGSGHIRASYEEAQSLLQYRWTLGANALLTMRELRATVSVGTRQLVQKEQAVVSSLSRGEFEQATRQLLELVTLASESVSSSETVRGLFAHLLGELDNLLQESGVELNELLGGGMMAQWNDMKSIYELQMWMVGQVIPAIRSHLESKQVPRRKKVVAQTIAAIRSQFETDLSLQLLADQLQVTPKSLSRWFKEETGEYFADYLIRFRMEKAREWLMHSDMPVREVAERLRYASVQNFSRIFKQTMGTTPGSLRTKSGRSNEEDTDTDGASEEQS